jgi:hypothetical protein
MMIEVYAPDANQKARRNSKPKDNRRLAEDCFKDRCRPCRPGSEQVIPARLAGK